MPPFKMFAEILLLYFVCCENVELKLLADSAWWPISTVSPRQSGICSPPKSEPGGRRGRRRDQERSGWRWKQCATWGGEKCERCGENRRQPVHLVLVCLIHLLPGGGRRPPFSQRSKGQPSCYSPKQPKSQAIGQPSI